jgi:hypothetical protein
MTVIRIEMVTVQMKMSLAVMLMRVEMPSLFGELERQR